MSQILLGIVLWKDSLDFIKIVKAKNVDGDALSLEQRVEFIIREHRGEHGNSLERHIGVDYN